MQQIVEERTKAVRRQGLAGHEHQWNVGACRVAAQVPGDLPAIAVGEVQVEKDKIRLASDRAFQPGSAVRRGLDAVVPFAEDIREQIADQRRILDHQNAKGLGARGAHGGSPAGRCTCWLDSPALFVSGMDEPAVQDVHQSQTALDDIVGIVPLPVVQRRLLQHLRVADDGVERRANFVADLVQKCRLSGR